MEGTAGPNRGAVGIIFGIEVRTVRHGSAEYENMLELRRRVLRRPLGLDLTEDDLAKEAVDLHIALFEEGRLLACAVLTDAAGRAKMRQVAVKPELQGQGLGAKLVEGFERIALEAGYSEIVLNARETAVSFYLRLGYELVGDPFIEVGLPHRIMRKTLNAKSGVSP